MVLKLPSARPTPAAEGTGATPPNTGPNLLSRFLVSGQILPHFGNLPGHDKPKQNENKEGKHDDRYDRKNTRKAKFAKTK